MNHIKINLLKILSYGKKEKISKWRQRTDKTGFEKRQQWPILLKLFIGF